MYKQKNRRFGWFISLLLALICYGLPVHAELFRFIRYEVEQGLPSNSVRSIVQDRQGFMWFGTEGGLARFDGSQFKVFRNISGDTSSLGNNYIFSLYEDTKGTFWVGTDEGIYCYAPQTETFTPFTVRTGSGTAITHNITSIQEDKQGNIWFGTLGQGVFRYEQTSETLHQYLLPGENSANQILCLFFDRAGTLWMSAKQSGETLYRLDFSTQQFIPVSLRTNHEKLSEFTVYALAEDTGGYLWLGTWKHGICRLDKLTGEIKTFLSQRNETKRMLHIHSITTYQPDILLVGSDDGLSCFHTKTGLTEQTVACEDENNSLSGKFVYPIYKDKEGGIWTGTYYGGVNYAAPAKGSFRGYAPSPLRNSVSGYIISCFCEDAAGNIWIGSDDGGLNYLNRKEGTFRQIPAEKGPNSLSYHNIHALCTDDNKLWIGTYSGGLNVLDLNTGHIRLYLPEEGNPHSIDGNSIYSVFRDSDGEIWIGSMFGITIYVREKDHFARVKQVGTTTLDMVEDNQRNIWFATLGKGLLRYNKENRKWEQYLHKTGDSGTLPSNQINSLCMDKTQQLWVGTDNGLCRYDAATRSFRRIPLKLPNNTICSIVSEGENLWLGTMQGLICYSTATGAHQTFYKSDGLQSDQFNPKACCLTSDGELYMGTINGFNVIRPRSVSRNAYVPPVQITNIQLFNKDLPIDREGILKAAPALSDQIELSYKEDVLNIEYAALSYSVPAKNQYKYILEGFDKDWNYVGNQRKATYTNLPAGTFRFRVAGSNNDGIWNEAGASLRVVKHPPFWQTTVAYILYLFIFVVALFLILYNIRRRTEKRHAGKIRQLETEKEKEVHDAKINFFTLIAHEIRTPVSLIIGPLEKIMNGSNPLPEGVYNDLKVINRNSQRLLQLVNQLLDFRKAEQGTFVLRPARYNIVELLQNLHDRFYPLVQQKGLSFTFEAETSELEVVTDAEALTKIVSNLLTNAAKYAQTQIALSCRLSGSCFIIEVADDGPGIQTEEQDHIFRPFYQVAQMHKPGTGIGLSLVKLLTDALHGEVSVESKPGEQTLFALRFPLTQPETNNIPSPPAEPEILFTPEETIENRLDTQPETNDKTRPDLLIVEDNADMCHFLQESFVSSYNVYTVTNGQEGLDWLHTHTADLIISDVMMPILDGISFCKEVKSDLQFSHIPFVLLTAKTDTASKLSGFRNGADVFIEKPFSCEVLKAQIDNLLKSRRMLQRKFSEKPFVSLKTIAGNPADEEFLVRMNNIIEQNCPNVEFSIDVLATELGISRSGLFAKIKHLAEMTPNELIQLVRLKKAAELLATRQYRINEICYKVGFNNPSYFSKCFQKQFGVLPKDFINNTN